MRAGVIAYCLIVVAITMGFLAGGRCYFAVFVNNELRPYFNQSGMESNSNHAQEVHAFLAISAVLLWLLCLATILKVSIQNIHFYCSRLVVIADSFIIGVLAALTLSHALDWGKYFDIAEGLNHLARNCQSLVGMSIANMVMMSIAISIAIFSFDYD
ncbi:hypothetical protein F5B19DRAFT_478026 [Rostrohypoxylon terebratum]|nr:hypothetical protein F5B19DRAFT_478026 [Rostrohypoxylon terebratum]